MEFSAKIRAARAVLGWTQEQLAIAAGLSPQSIPNVERGDNAPTARTQEKLVRTLLKHGVVLTDKGVEYQEYPVFFTTGKDHEQAYLALLEDAHEHLLSVKNPELLIMYADDRVSPASVNNKYRAMRKDGIRMRQLIEKGNDYIIGPLDEYRFIPKSEFINRVKLIYGNRIANETADVLRGVIKVDPVNAEIERNTFNILWGVLEKPTRSIADERFD